MRKFSWGNRMPVSSRTDRVDATGSRVLLHQVQHASCELPFSRQNPAPCPLLWEAFLGSGKAEVRMLPADHLSACVPTSPGADVRRDHTSPILVLSHVPRLSLGSPEAC